MSRAVRDTAIAFLRAGTKPIKTDIVDFVARVDISDLQQLLSEVSGKSKMQLSEAVRKDRYERMIANKYADLLRVQYTKAVDCLKQASSWFDNKMQEIPILCDLLSEMLDASAVV